MQVMIIEDEPMARDGLRALLEREPDVEVVGAFGDGASALDAIREHRPDVIFVDVEMPGSNGVETVSAIAPDSRPFVIFVTAHDTYAAAAFDVEAVDYVLKPVDEARLSLAVQRARRAIDAMRIVQAKEPVGTEAAEARPARVPGKAYLTRLSARVGDKLVVVKLADTSWIEAQGDYMRVHAAGRSLMIRATMRELEQQLDPLVFVRAHRSALVNIEAVVTVEVLDHGEHVARLTDGSRVRVGRMYKRSLFDALGERT